jgi:hypothetical protein
MTKSYKVALGYDVRGITYHHTLGKARRSKEKHGFKYHVYKLVEMSPPTPGYGNKVWMKVE